MRNVVAALMGVILLLIVSLLALVVGSAQAQMAEVWSDGGNVANGYPVLVDNFTNSPGVEALTVRLHNGTPIIEVLPLGVGGSQGDDPGVDFAFQPAGGGQIAEILEARAFVGDFRPALMGNEVYVAAWCRTTVGAQVVVHALFTTSAIPTDASLFGEPTNPERALRVAPNPSTGSTRIEWTSRGGEEPVTVRLFDVAGRARYEAVAGHLASSIDIEALSAGVYFAEVTQGGVVLGTGKVLVVR